MLLGRRRLGFTLVELMIVVAIIGILASIAIPMFVEMQFKSKRAEVPMNVKAIKEAEEIFNADEDGYLAVASFPSANPPGKATQAWTSSSTGFNQLNWRPDGEVRGVYSVTTTAPSSTTPGGDFVVSGRADIDGDSVELLYTATKSLNSTRITGKDVY